MSRISQRLYFSLTASVFLVTILVVSLIPYDVKGIEGLGDPEGGPGGGGAGGGGPGGGGGFEPLNAEEFGLPDDDYLDDDDRMNGFNDDRFPMNDRFGMRDDYPFNPRMRDDMMEERGEEVYDAKGKRFKLYEKKGLTHAKAELFCKKREGKLAQAMNIDEMQRLQNLLMKAKMVATNLWIGADKKEWKPHSTKERQNKFKPDLGPNAVVMGGGPLEMCPALSASTRALTPAECYKEYPFVCEYLPGKGKIPRSKRRKNGTKSGRRMKMPRMRRPPRPLDEMRKKREIVSLPVFEAESEPTQAVIKESTVTSMTSESGSTTTAESITSTSTETSNQETPSAEHNIGFKPHIIAAQSPKPSSMLPISTILGTPLETSKPLKRFDSAAAKMFLKLHTSLNMNPNIAGSDAVQVPFAEPENSIGTESGATAETKAAISTTEVDPDQQMVNLIDEQSASMSLEPVQPEPEPEPCASSTTEAAGRHDLSTASPSTPSTATPENATMDAESVGIPSESKITSKDAAPTTAESSKLPETLSSTVEDSAAGSTTTFTTSAGSTSQVPTTMTTITDQNVQLTASPHIEPPTVTHDGVNHDPPMLPTATEVSPHPAIKPESAGNALAEASGKRPARNSSMPSLLQPTGALLDASVAPKVKEHPDTSSSMPGFLLTPKTHRERSTNEEHTGSTSDVSEEPGSSTASSRPGKFNGLLQPKPSMWQQALDYLPILNKFVAG